MNLLPDVTPETHPFWTGGLEGKLLIAVCDTCDHRIHPPQPVCPKCQSEKVTPKPSSGRGTIYTYTVNHQKWSPDMEVPFVIAIVDLDDQPGVRLTAQIRDCEIDEVTIGSKVTVDFDPIEDVAIPFFRLTN